MQEKEIIEIWKSYQQKLDSSLQMNKKCLQEIQLMKASSSLKPVRLTRWIGIVFGLVWLLFIAFLMYHSLSWSKLVFLLSAGIHFIVSLYAILVYIHHLVLLDQFDNSNSIVEAQQKLVLLSTSNLRVLGILLVQLPVFSTWYMNLEWMHSSPETFWGIQVPIVLIQAWMGWWAFRNLHYRNHEKKWFRWFLSKGEFATFKRATALLKEAEMPLTS
ncbi:hypothetical protein [Flavihumibacter sp. CACIAM 22H1]|uniref:hypothetical protein n=1 Tax=Flavihumibacter sp. CACIAM 22H1 TaxID=1812911 RepID=UPI0007A7FA85|nr:hypothetical protein [Flavihumibacter sp. CACIAM 22H1]KYP15754.1 MAG: hypothetical protein A1D16_05290 [Flavihumibacter sp. CACIAM 22H1]